MNVCVLFFFPGGGVPNLTWRGGSEVCVVISGQHQGQVYLCDTANLGSSAHSRHHVSEGCPGRTGQIKNKMTVSFQFCQQLCKNVRYERGLTILHRTEKNLSCLCLFIKSKGSFSQNWKSASICDKQLQGCKMVERLFSFSLTCFVLQLPEKQQPNIDWTLHISQEPSKINRNFIWVFSLIYFVEWRTHSFFFFF